jgi:hypothetical protein
MWLYYHIIYDTFIQRCVNMDEPDDGDENSKIFPIQDLPNEILCVIFFWLTKHRCCVENILSVRLVCKRWWNLVDKYPFSGWHERSYTNPEIKRILGMFPKSKFSLRYGNSQQIKDVLPYRSTVTSLNIERFSAEFMRDLPKFTELTFLSVTGCGRHVGIRRLKKLGKLQELYIECPIISIRSVKYLTDLRVLDIEGTDIQDISFLKNLVNLHRLNLAGLSIKNGKDLSNLTNLTCLNICRNPISDLRFIRNLTKLKFLNIGYTSVSNIDDLEHLKYLEVLIAWNTSISSLFPLRNTNTLQRIDLWMTDISDIEDLRCLTNIENITLKHTSISDISPVRMWEKLWYIDISNTNVSDIECIYNLPKLSNINVSNTKINAAAVVKLMDMEIGQVQI